MVRVKESVRPDAVRSLESESAHKYCGRWHQRFILALIALAPWLLGGCGSTGPVAQDRFYVLEPQTPVWPVSGAPLPATLRVNDLSARGFLGGRQIVYRTRERPLQIQRYDLLLWEEPPGQAIAGNLASELREVALFDYVVTPDQGSRSDYILSGELDRFEHRPTAAVPRVEADFTLTLLDSINRRSLFSHRYQGQEPTTASTPEEMAEAFNRLTGRLVEQAVRDLRTMTPGLKATSRREGEAKRD